MELVNFSVTNFRSITKAHKISISGTTILIGKNNEGKSNILKALDVAMNILKNHAYRMTYKRQNSSIMRRNESSYFWERDFPITIQSRKTNTSTILRLEFLLSSKEITEFKSEIKSNLNGTLPIEIKIGKDNTPSIKVAKRGSGTKTLNTKSNRIAEFIANKIVFNYIPAVRTDHEALEVVQRMLSQHLRVLEEKEEYINALKTIENLQKPILDKLSNQIKEPLVEFLPTIKDVKIEISDEKRRSLLRNQLDIIVDDGTATNLSYKGDGVKSLAALGLLKAKINTQSASIIAIEEPESHLHPAAIHQLKDVIHSLEENNQVILTTHNPLFVDRNDIKSNIIVHNSNAKPAKGIKQIRDLLGIKASDNLINANYVLVVEGEDDVITLKALLPTLSEKIAKAIKSNLLIIDQIGGAGNLSYKLTLLGNSLCVYHTFLDHDEAGRLAYEKAEEDNLITIKSNTFITCNGSTNSELEDSLNVSVYKDSINDEYGVDIGRLSGNKKWSDKVKDVFLTQGKQWNDRVESKVKYTVANSVHKNPTDALNEHKRNSIDALVTSLETMMKI